MNDLKFYFHYNFWVFLLGIGNLLENVLGNALFLNSNLLMKTHSTSLLFYVITSYLYRQLTETTRLRVMSTYFGLSLNIGGCDIISPLLLLFDCIIIFLVRIWVSLALVFDIVLLNFRTGHRLMGAYIDGGAHDWDVGEDGVDEDIIGNIFIIATIIFVHNSPIQIPLEQRKSFVSRSSIIFYTAL